MLVTRYRLYFTLNMSPHLSLSLPFMSCPDGLDGLHSVLFD